MPFYAFASPQEHTVQGVVNEASGQVLVGVSVVIEGTIQGTVTDQDGKFSIQVPMKIVYSSSPSDYCLNNKSSILDMDIQLNVRFLLILSLLWAVSACNTWKEDIKVDKNIGTSSSPAPYMEAMFSRAISIDGSLKSEDISIDVMSGVAEHFAKTRALSQGNRRRSWHDFNSKIWPNYYYSLCNVKAVCQAAQSITDNRYVAVADIRESWVMYQLTMLHGAIPYYQSLAIPQFYLLPTIRKLVMALMTFY